MTRQVAEVFDMERLFAATSDPDAPVCIMARWRFGDHALNVIRRLRTVERRELEPKILVQVIEAWTARLN